MDIIKHGLIVLRSMRINHSLVINLDLLVYISANT